jgi:CelD/BcsL family acetyltransferase involved in cellulose biosynthesis
MTRPAGTIKAESHRPDQLDATIRQAWLDSTLANAQFASPFFHPDYSQLMAKHRPQVEVAVFKQDEQPVGFMAFERHAHSIARPLGIRLSDFQGLVCHDSLELNLDEMLPALQLHQLHFDHLLAEQCPPSALLSTADSPFIDLNQGFEAYIRSRRQHGSELATQIARKRRKLEREIGKVSFQWHDTDPEAFELLVKWKSAQRQRTGTVNVLDFPWVQAFLQDVRHHQTASFSGVMATVRVNDRIIATHLGMVTSSRMHYWIPAYDIEFGTYSPGSILLLSVAEECERRSIQRIDLGKGDERYKSSFADGSTSVALGVVDSSRLRHTMRSTMYRWVEKLKSSYLQDWIQTPKRLLRKWQTRNWMGSK